MKNKSLLYILVLPLAWACSKQESIEDPEFYISSSAFTYRVADTANFFIKGNPDVITFYSGEAGNNYDNRDRTFRTDGQFKFGFQSRVDNAAGFAALAAGALRVLVSTNYLPTYSTLVDPVAAGRADSAMVNAATWTDVTSRFAIPSTGTVSTFYPSGEVNLSDLVTDPNKPIYIAFRYASPTTSTLGTNGITLGSLVLNNVFPEITQSFNVNPGGSTSTIWRIVRAANTANAWTTSSTQLKFISSTTTGYSEDWVITNAYYPNLVAPDKAVPIKNITNAPITTFKYKFSTPGIYKVTFIASNNRPGQRKEVLKQLELTITP